MRRFTGMIASAAVVLSVVTGCGGSASEKPAAPNAPAPAAEKKAEKKAVTLMLNWIPYGEHAPFYYGVEKGYFAAEGIDLTIQPGGGSGKTVQAVGSKQVTFGWADGPALINGITNGIPVKSVGSFLQVGPGSVEFFAEKNFKTPADLKGKSIAMTAGDAVSQTFVAFLAANNMTIKDVNVVNIDPAGKIAALSEGKVDAILGFFHDQAPTIANNTKKPVNVLKYADYGVNVMSNGIIAHNETLKSDPEMVKAFLRASIKSWEEAAKDQAGAVEAMAKKAEKAPPKEVMAKQLEQTLTLLNTANTKGKRPGVNVEADWKATVDLMAKYADLKKVGAPSDYWDGSFAPK